MNINGTTNLAYFIINLIHHMSTDNYSCATISSYISYINLSNKMHEHVVYKEAIVGLNLNLNINYFFSLKSSSVFLAFLLTFQIFLDMDLYIKL
jgi:hypothetical protein